MSVRTATGLMFLLALAVPPAVAQSPDIKFVGQSRATPQLKRDILTAVTGYSKARHSCAAVTTVETAPLPQG